jgi:diacylglycerol kinase (ATP)
MLNKITIIANPIAGSGKVKKFMEHFKAGLSQHHIKADLKLTTQSGDAYDIGKQYTESHPIVCLSGDGTFNEAINGIMNNKRFTALNRPPMGIIPFGSGNVIAKELSLKRNTQHFIHLYKNNLLRNLDIGSVHFLKENKKRYFISMAGIGFDAEVARQYQLGRNGAKLQAHLFSYLPITLKTISCYKMPRITVQVEGKTVAKNASFVQVANARSYGGPFVLVDNALPDDGLLDVAWFKGTSPLNIVRYYSLAFLGCTDKAHDMRQIKTTKVILSSSNDTKIPLQVDGDWCGYLPVEIEIIPKSIRIYTLPDSTLKK